MALSVLSPLQLTSMDALLHNQGLGISPVFLNSVISYNTLPMVAPLLEAIVLGSQTANVVDPDTGNVTNVPYLQPATFLQLESIGNTTCPALGDSIPAAYGNLLPLSNVYPGFINSVYAFAQKEAGYGDVTKFIQAFYGAQAYAQQTNDFVLSTAHANTYLGGTFTTTNDQITGYITATTTDMPAFAKDLANLGNLIDLSNLDNWGLPSALLKQVIKVSAGIPSITPILLANGVDINAVANLTDPKASFTDTVEKQMYNAMQYVTGDPLEQVLTVLNITTKNITTMADLLNVMKIFPNSYQTLTVPIATGTVNIYINSSSVNSQLATQLPPYVISSVV